MKYLALIILLSHAYEISPATSYCILKTESSFVHIKGDGGQAIGYGQLHTNAIKDSCKYLELDCRNMRAIKYRIKTDHRFAIKLSLTYYKTLLDAFNGDQTRAIMAYQAGIGTIQAGHYNWTYFAKVKSCENDLIEMSNKE